MNRPEPTCGGCGRALSERTYQAFGPGECPFCKDDDWQEEGPP